MQVEAGRSVDPEQLHRRPGAFDGRSADVGRGGLAARDHQQRARCEDVDAGEGVGRGDLVDSAQHPRVLAAQVRTVCGAVALVSMPEMVRCRFVDFLGHDVCEEGGLAEGLGHEEQAGAGGSIAEDDRVLTATGPASTAGCRGKRYWPCRQP
ncbi:hypothetical protein [Streptomyces coriariae]|uniref:hypothetical protein n=1 Tax=Streptomyces coriariae TaxID=2864460 RepID=UPI001E2927EC|nr:hypothetical protein [Streptomyces coriariae]